MKALLQLVLGMAWILAWPVHASEVIHNFHSEIYIQADGQLQVVETIEVRAEGQQIRRGIYRDFPTTYHDKLGNTVRVGFDVLSVERDGKPEPYHLKSQSNGQRVYIGDSNVFLTPGDYQYRIRYTTDRQLGFFEDFDELYWNVTGNGWDFPIEKASARIHLPQPVPTDAVKLTGYTGVFGSEEQALRHRIEDSDSFYFEALRKLQSREGLTIVASWPKGIIQEPSAADRRQHYIEDNRHNLIAIGGLFVVLAYYLLVWIKLGRDPEQGVIMPRYQAPEGFSPASTRFISNMAYDKSCFTTALVNLTIKGLIAIDKDSSDKFVITRHQVASAPLAAGEAVILRELFRESEQVTLTQSEHKRLSKAINQHETSLRGDYEKLYFLTNKRYFIPGILVSIAAMVYAIIQIPDEQTRFSTLFVGAFTLIPFVMIGVSFKRFLKKRKTFGLFQLIIQLAGLGIFFFIAGDIVSEALKQLSSVSWPLLVSLYLLLASNLLFEQWLKAPTLAGRRLLDQIEGFRLYLNVAEEDELKLRGQPQFTTDIYEAFLPYAIALGVDHAWSQKLERAIAAGLVQANYHPRGFAYYNHHQGVSDFSDSLSQGLDSAISSSSTAPGSSSGSSGGSSGGGGGGGGGGGW